MTERYWFARRFPLSDPRKSVAPVTWQGVAVALAFVGGMLISGVAYAVLATLDEATIGIAAFGVGAALSATAFIGVSCKTADMARTVEDYKAGRAS